MKRTPKILVLLLASAMLSTMTSCLSADEDASDPQQSMMNTTDGWSGQQGDSNSNNEDNDFEIDRYVGIYSLDNRKVVAIKNSGAIEEIGTAYDPKYSNDGRYLVFKKGWNKGEVFYKEPDHSKVLIRDDVYYYDFEEEKGFLLLFCEAGIYYAESVTATPVKIGNHQGDIDRYSMGRDYKNALYIADEQLHLLSLEAPYTDTVISEDVEWTESFAYLSPDRIFFTKIITDESGEDYVKCLWDGSTVTQTDLYFDSSALYYWCWKDFDELRFSDISSNGKYVVDREITGDVYRYEVNQDGIFNKTYIGHAYNLALGVSNDGKIVLFGAHPDELSVYVDGTVYDLGEADLCRSEPIIDNDLYYLLEESLMKINLENGETSKIVDNVQLFEVKNGYCYYLSDDVLYRTDLSFPLSDGREIVTLNGLVN